MREWFGLRIAEVGDPAEVTGAHVEQAHLVRLAGADKAPPGFLARPEELTWIAENPAGLESFVQQQSKRQRQRTRHTLRMTAGLQVRVWPPGQARHFDQWLPLYQQQIASMSYGVDMATRDREEILDPAGGHTMLTVHRGDELLGGCVCYDQPELEIFRVRFCALWPQLRDQDLPRVLYAHAAQVGHELGRAKFTLGSDPNLYGHMTKPGLCAYKTRLGFRPVATHDLEPDEGTVRVERLTGLEGLQRPVLVYCYDAETGPGAPLRLHGFGPAGERAQHHAIYGWMVEEWHDIERI